jgi:secreted trypsin-like serine protease
VGHPRASSGQDTSAENYAAVPLTVAERSGASGQTSVVSRAWGAWYGQRMRRSSFLGCLLVSSLLGCGRNEVEEASTRRDEIVGGIEATPGEWPGVVLLYRRVCGGALVAPSWVVTAAHCLPVPADANGGVERVIVGRHRRSTHDGEEIRVKRAISHALWGQPSINANDIALLELETPTSYPIAKLVRQDEISAAYQASAVATVVGWGTTLDAGLSDPLMKVDIPLFSNDECKTFKGYEGVTDGMVCAGFREGGRGACNSDSGGPLYSNVNGERTLIGTVSGGRSCTAPNSPNIYTRLGAYLDWMRDKSGGAVSPE